MSTDTAGGLAPYKLPRHLSPDQVRGANFERAPFGRRGFEEQEVHDYLGRVAEELAGRDGEIARLAAENRQLKHALREWHRQLVGYDSAEIIARTQQHIEAQIAQAEQYSREREEEAAQRYDEILAEAHLRAQDEAERLVLEQAGRGGASAGGAGAGTGASAVDPEAERRREREWFDRQRTYVSALQQALGALAAQVGATQQAFSMEADRIVDGVASPPRPELSAGPAPPTPPPTPTTLRPAPGLGLDGLTADGPDDEAPEGNGHGPDPDAGPGAGAGADPRVTEPLPHHIDPPTVHVEPPLEALDALGPVVPDEPTFSPRRRGPGAAVAGAGSDDPDGTAYGPRPSTRRRRPTRPADATPPPPSPPDDPPATP